jgi:hypothetical protein
MRLPNEQTLKMKLANINIDAGFQSGIHNIEPQN